MAADTDPEATPERNGRGLWCLFSRGYWNCLLLHPAGRCLAVGQMVRR